ncbi:elongation factor 1-delta-like isoform X1 [Cimex lectularius]|uniref:Elongation factor 1-delta n=1 Tax=Cimex lectularius TaxID=79782 RepID=A0A8I6RML4_CIMLE|nr:elongation factor 1-delta-like isoform X1 [Cimex lectularius]XP_024083775.1 elongation factor 1-delta-like isoform X1 [Cimex lectularius]
MLSTSSLAKEKVWVQKPKYDLAEKQYYEKLAKLAQNSQPKTQAQAQQVPQEKVVNKAPEPVPEAAVPKADPKGSKKSQEQQKKTAQAVVPEVKNQAKDLKNTQECHEKLQKGLQNSLKKEHKNKQDSNPPLNKDLVANPVTDLAPVPVKVEDPPPPADYDTKENQSHIAAFDFELTIKCNSKKAKKAKKERKRNNNVNNNNVNNENNANNAKKGAPQSVNTLAGEVAKAREHIKNSMQCIDNVTSMTSNLVNGSGANKLQQLEKDHTQLKQKVGDMSQLIVKLEQRVTELEKALASKTTSATKASQHSPQPKQAPPAAKPQDDDADDGVDLFASDSEDEDTEAAKIKEQRLAEYAARKSKKPALIAKSNIILDVKPWDDETDMKKMEEEVRKIKTDGLVWGASKLVPLAYGIHKLQISSVVEDDKVSVDWLQETIEQLEDYVQSVDIAAFNKI